MTTTVETTNSGVSENNTEATMFKSEATESHTVDDVADMFLNRWKDGESPSEHDKGAMDDEEDETPPSESENEREEAESDTEETDEESEVQEEAEEEGDTEEVQEHPVADPEAVYKITVDGEERTVPVKDLARLYGQEASLTRKSQELSAKRKEVEEVGAKHVLGLQALVERAQEQFKPYAEIDFWVASKELSSEDFTALRQNAIAAKEQLDFLTTELDTTLKAHQERHKQAVDEAAKEAVAVLSKKDWWSADAYNNLRTYAVSVGLNADEVNNYVDPVVIELIYKAMKYDDTKKAASTKKVATAPKKVLKPSAKTVDASPTTKKKLDKTKLQSRDPDDITDAILGRWAKE